MKATMKTIAVRFCQMGLLLGVVLLARPGGLHPGERALADEVSVVIDGTPGVVVQGDPSGAAICGLGVSPNPAERTASIQVNATAGCAGNEFAILGAEFFAGPVGPAGTGRRLEPLDGAFDSPTEVVSGSMSAGSLAPGSYVVSARAQDVSGAWGALATTTLEVAASGEVTTYGDTGGVEVPKKPTSGPAPADFTDPLSTTAAAGAAVHVGQQNGGTQPERQFNATTVTIPAGSAVQWVVFDTWSGQGHDIQAYDGSFSSGAKSGLRTVGQVFEHSFGAPGTYTYYCGTHAGASDADPARIDERIAQGKMVGKVVVEEVTAGTFGVTSRPVAFGIVAVTGQDQDVDSAPATWSVTDASGAGAGWNVTLVASDLSAESGAIPAGHMRVQLLQSAILPVSGNSPPATNTPSFQALDATTPLKLLSAAGGTGMGTYDFTPEFRLTIPAETTPGTYASSITVSLNTGP